MATLHNPPEIDGPPPKTNEELPQKSVLWESVQLPVDILLLTVKNCEFLHCISILNDVFRGYHDGLGKVYFGNIEDEGSGLKIALIKCDKGSGGPGGSTVVVKDAVDVLGPKAVFCVGFCGGLIRNKVKLGDVVVSAKVVTYAPTKALEDGIQDRGYRVPPSKRILDLIRSVADGWKAPLKDPKQLQVEVHRDAAFLSGPELVDKDDRRKELVQRFPEAIAIEMEGEGLHAAAHNMRDVPWVIIKGVSDFADGKKTDTNSWRPFASAMAASVVAHLLSDSIVFKNWPNYGQYAETRGPNESSKRGADLKTAEHSERDPKRRKLNVPTTVKCGTPTNDELETLSVTLGADWVPLARKLFPEDTAEANIEKFDLENRRLEEKAYQMLLNWKRSNGTDATYEVLYVALRKSRKDLAEQFCS